MKIAIIDISFDNETPAASRILFPNLLAALAAEGDEIHLWSDEKSFFENDATDAANQRIFFHDEPQSDFAAQVLTDHLRELEPDVYLLWNAADVYWNVLPLLAPKTAIVAVGHADAEVYYRPVRHFRPFLTRLIGTTPEVCVGFVINCVIEKEKVEWIGDESAVDAPTDLQQLVESYRHCLKTAQTEAQTHPREDQPNFSPLIAPRRHSFLSRLKKLISK